MKAYSFPSRFTNWIETDISSTSTIGMIFYAIATVCCLLFEQTAVMIITAFLIGPIGVLIAALYCLNPGYLLHGPGFWFWMLGRAIIYFTGFGVITAIFLKYVVLPAFGVQ